MRPSNFLPPVVILGSERSGTNLLRALLSTHSKIASPPPAGFIDALGGIQPRYFPVGRSPRVWSLIDDVVALTRTHLNPWDIDLEPPLIRARLQRTSLWEIFRVVNEMYAEASGRACWCSKEPGLFRHISEMAEQLPDARFVYLVRDGRDVASSVLRGHLHDFHVYFAAQSWASVQRYCLRALADPEQSAKIHVLKYEDLLDDPEESMRAVMRFVGLQFEAEQLDYYRNEKVLDHSRRSRFWKNLGQPIDTGNKGWYRRRLGIANTTIFESVAWAEMDALGYALDTSRRRVFTGTDIRLYRALALVRKGFWSLDPRAEAVRTRARVKATHEIMGRTEVS